jgi:hypothetical protein
MSGEFLDLCLMASFRFPQMGVELLDFSLVTGHQFLDLRLVLRFCFS